MEMPGFEQKPRNPAEQVSKKRYKHDISRVQLENLVVHLPVRQVLDPI